MEGVDTVERIGGDKRRKRNNFGRPWQEPRRRIIGGEYLERASRNRIQRKVLWQIGKSECLDGDGRRLGGKMTLCCSWGCWDGDGGRPGGRMNLSGSYGRD